MKTLKVTLCIWLSLAMFLTTYAADGKLTGVWKVSDVKITGKAKTHCYLCDLYEHKGSLEFTPEGKVRYYNAHDGREVFYYTNGNKLVLSVESAATLKVNANADKAKNDTTVEFEFSLNNNVLTLKKVFDGYTETYTLTK